MKLQMITSRYSKLVALVAPIFGGPLKIPTAIDYLLARHRTHGITRARMSQILEKNTFHPYEKAELAAALIRYVPKKGLAKEDYISLLFGTWPPSFGLQEQLRKNINNPTEILWIGIRIQEGLRFTGTDLKENIVSLFNQLVFVANSHLFSIATGKKLSPSQRKALIAAVSSLHDLAQSENEVIRALTKKWIEDIPAKAIMSLSTSAISKRDLDSVTILIYLAHAGHSTVVEILELLPQDLLTAAIKNNPPLFKLFKEIFRQIP